MALSDDEGVQLFVLVHVFCEDRFLFVAGVLVCRIAPVIVNALPVRVDVTFPH